MTKVHSEPEHGGDRLGGKWLRRLLGRGSDESPTTSQESAAHRCSHCGYDVPGVGANPVSCPRCGQVLRFIA